MESTKPFIAYQQYAQNLQSLKGEIDALKQLFLQVNKFSHLPEWIKRDYAFEILQISKQQTLNGYVKEGLIKCKQVSTRGDLRYSKADCMLFAERWEEHQQKKISKKS